MAHHQRTSHLPPGTKSHCAGDRERVKVAPYTGRQMGRSSFSSPQLPPYPWGLHPWSPWNQVLPVWFSCLTTCVLLLSPVSSAQLHPIGPSSPGSGTTSHDSPLPCPFLSLPAMDMVSADTWHYVAQNMAASRAKGPVAALPGPCGSPRLMENGALGCHWRPAGVWDLA